MNLISDRESLSDEALEKYTEVFSRPLSRNHIAALAALFGWNVPPEYQVHDATEITTV